MEKAQLEYVKRRAEAASKKQNINHTELSAIDTTAPTIEEAKLEYERKLQEAYEKGLAAASTSPKLAAEVREFERKKRLLKAIENGDIDIPPGL